jgi:hypothetical protein
MYRVFTKCGLGVLLFLTMAGLAWAQNPVTFSVNMSIQEQLGNFNPATKLVVIRGSFEGEASGNAVEDWHGNFFQLALSGTANVWEGTFDIPVGSYEYKFVIIDTADADDNTTQSGQWETVDNRQLTVPSGGVVLSTVFFDNRESTGATATVTFQADLTNLITNGYFDAGTDTLYVPGSFNGWPGKPTPQDITQPDLFNPTLYKLEREITAEIGSTINWKFRALPQTKFANTGWESGDNHSFTFTGSNIVLDAFVPAIGPAGQPLVNDVTVQFSVDANYATDTYNGRPFVKPITGVFLQGEVAPVGSWACGWTVSDTGCFKKLYDDGAHGGDAVAGDGIWTGQVLFPAGTPNLSEYKYGIVSAGVDTLNGGVNPLDNEAGFAQNHKTPFIADQAGVFVLPTDKFSSQRVLVNPVKFSVNMSIQKAIGVFDPLTELVVIRGSFEGEGSGDGVEDWHGNFFRLKQGTTTDVYEGTWDIAEGSYEYKFVIISATDYLNNTTQDGAWESVDNRQLTVPAAGVTLPVVFFNNQETAGATATVTFQADLTSLITNGYFDAGTDTLYVPGSHNGWPGKPAAEDIAQADLFNPTLYKLERQITAEIGSTVNWKFRALPASKFGNTGWETGDNHTFTFTGSNIVLDAFVPAIGPTGKPLTNNVTVQFSVDVTNAKDTYNNKPFAQPITGVFLQGEVTPLGGWTCGWTVSDTACFKKLYDDGAHGGDATAGDGIWTTQVLFPAGTPNLTDYKYGIVAAGVDTLNGGVNPLDNEAGFGLNHRTPFIADQAGVFVLGTDVFGDQVTAVEERPGAEIPASFKLGNSYPNPFNPTAKITYDVAQNSRVVIRVYDTLGRLVANLVDRDHVAGAYTVEWNATDLRGKRVASGVYLYEMVAGSFRKTQRMLLLK